MGGIRLICKSSGKADMLQGIEPSRYNCQIRTISKGLINAQGKSFSFANFAHPDDLFRIMEHGNNSALARVAYISYLFSLRVPSETLQLIRAPSTAPLLKCIPQEPKVLIGVQTFEQIEVLAMKFKYRKKPSRRAHTTPALPMQRTKNGSTAPLPGPLLVEGNLRISKSRGPSVPQNLRQFRQSTN